MLIKFIFLQPSIPLRKKSVFNPLKNKIIKGTGGSDITNLDLNKHAEQKEEAVSALIMLGFASAASQKTVEKILHEQPTLKVEQLIKLALKMM